MLGFRLIELRKEKNMTQEKIAKALNIAQSSYSLYEKEKRSPDYDTLQKLAAFFNVTTSYLIGETDVKHAPTTDQNNSMYHHKVDGYDDLDAEDQKRVQEYIALLKLKYSKE